MYISKKQLNAWTEIWDFTLAGSSFKATDGTRRQTSLRRAAKKQNDFERFETVTVDLERYEYEGAPAYMVYFDDREVGNVPAEIAAELAKMEDAGYIISGDSCEIYGGPDEDDPDKKYGARIFVKLRRNPTSDEQRAELFARIHADPDDLLIPAIHAVYEAGGADAAILQRKLKIGYYQAGIVIGEMSELGVIGGFKVGEPREVLLSREQFEELFPQEVENCDVPVDAASFATPSASVPTKAENYDPVSRPRMVRRVVVIAAIVLCVLCAILARILPAIL